MPVLPQTRLGRYEIRSLIGKGGMGEVYLAYDSSLRRQVAIKLLPAELTQNEARLSRFKREAYAASSLNHPYILTIYEIGEQDGQHFIAPSTSKANLCASTFTHADGATRGLGNRRASRFSTLGRTSDRHRTSRHQAGEYHAQAGWLRQSTRLRAGEAGR